jgi:glycosyltransferase involved in cell wall biosynthesis
LRIAQVAPLYESVPPKLHGGTERAVSYLTEELVAQGHDVTLFASGDSKTTARLVSTYPRALRLDKNSKDHLVHHLVMLEEVFRRTADFDVVHFHVAYLHYPLSRRGDLNQLTTLHGRLDNPDLEALYREYLEMPVVSVSNTQRGPLPYANWLSTVYPGLPLTLHALHEEPGDYLAFVGRIAPEKRVDRAIEIARRAGLPLRIAAKVERADRAYFNRVIRPLFDQSHVSFLGEVGEREKDALLGQARALLFPGDWKEPFGLVLTEALSCGTPVIAWRSAAVEELLEHGATGYLVDDLSDAVAAVGRLDALSRRHCRAAFEERFSARRMARDYVALYQRLLANAHRRPLLPRRYDRRATHVM